jgi:acetolactate synthase-1/2/3 large subunit
MDSSDISGAGLPFAIGTAIGNPDNRVTLICDKDSLFYHVRELQPAISMGLDFNIICIDEVNNATNVADTASVLEGLGCDVHGFDPGKDKDNDLLKHKTGIPGAVIFRPAEKDK